MSSRTLDRRLDWVALNMHYIAGSAIVAALATLVAAWAA
jgi:hypothetical protein